MNLKTLSLGVVLASFMLSGCSSITMLRTKEMRAVGDDVIAKNDSAYKALSVENAALRAELDSVKAQLDASAVAQKRLQAEVTVLSNRMSEETVRRDTRQEEIIYRLDLLLGKSDKILAKKVVVNNGVASAVMEPDANAEKMIEAETMFNAAHSDYHRGEYKLAYNGFKQVYELVKKGEMAEGALYWMSLCLMEANQPAKAKTLLTNLVDSNPQGMKACSGMFKLATIYGNECNLDRKKQYLQMILSNNTCASTPELEQAAISLQEMLDFKSPDGRSATEICREQMR
ncbi:tetratricopeptide repeat protein [Fibrobacter succinogenes]|uniref:Beta-barrel assembly machine subunit BamD n=1 Tax=Fibrobacter succinogenes TaxID=833 RepID=A0A380RW39_FIBSU|nr:tetratricopeptide repeat protein [Fibrobacter succinogenes]PWJ37511.1 TolA-binding protein [Fibrobacter succinogenes subsp. elongatus]SUQ19758.1 Beta-barrel assembly machine subunit BamD [Fibrobacter succinogenes]